MYDRLVENYRVKCEINNFYSDLNKLNTHDLHIYRSRYFDIKFRLQFVNFVIFHDFQTRRLQKKLNMISKKIMETEFEQEISESSFRRKLV